MNKPLLPITNESLDAIMKIREQLFEYLSLCKKWNDSDRNIIQAMVNN